MAKIKVKTIEEVQKVISNKINAIQTKKILEEIGQLVVKETVSRFKNNQIKPRTSTETLLNRRAKGYKRIKDAKKPATRAKLMSSSLTMVDTGKLMRSIKYMISERRKTVYIGTNVEYAAIHQFGGMTGRRKSVKIPKRPFLFFTSVTRLQIGRILKRAAERAGL